MARRAADVAPLAITLRDMEPKDIEAVLEIERASFGAPWTRALFEREMALAFSRTFLACTQEAEGERIVGYAIVWFVSDELHLLNLAVAPTHRRRGVGEKLLERVVAEAVCQACQVITLEVRATGKAAQALYHKAGFVPVAVRKGYYSDNGEDAIVMVLEV